MVWLACCSWWSYNEPQGLNHVGTSRRDFDDALPRLRHECQILTHDQGAGMTG